MPVFPPLGTEKKRLALRILAIAVLVSVFASCLVPTAFARNTYVITDGEETKVYTTYATDPAYVLDQAGVELGAADTYVTETADGVSEITVKRNQNITIQNCGESLETTSYGESVGQLLERMGIPAYGEYVVSVDLEEETYDGMQIQVDRVIQSRQTYTEDIPFETTVCYDPSMPQGEEKVIVAGVTGQLKKTADVVYVNSQETSHTVVEETVVQQPVTQIVSVGTGEALGSTGAPSIGDGVIVTADGQVLTYSSTAQYVATAYTHTDAGCDFITATGTTVRIGTVAVDPTMIRYGTRMFIVANDGSYVYGIGTAEDCGGSIKGNRLDLYYPTTPECWAFGVRNCTVYFLD